MLDEMELIQVRDDTTDLLPESVGQDPKFVTTDDPFAEVDKQFDEHGNGLDIDPFDIRHAKWEAGLERLIKRSEQQEKWLNLATSQLGDEKGQRLEDLVAEALRYEFENPEITPESVSLRQKVVDTEGLVFKRGFETEVDLIALENKLMVFKLIEIKALTKASDVDFFALKVELIAHQNPEKEVQGLLISFAASQKIRQRCAKYGLELVP